MDNGWTKLKLKKKLLNGQWLWHNHRIANYFCIENF